MKLLLSLGPKQKAAVAASSELVVVAGGETNEVLSFNLFR